MTNNGQWNVFKMLTLYIIVLLTLGSNVIRSQDVNGPFSSDPLNVQASSDGNSITAQGGNLAQGPGNVTSVSDSPSIVSGTGTGGTGGGGGGGGAGAGGGQGGSSEMPQATGVVNTALSDVSNSNSNGSPSTPPSAGQEQPGSDTTGEVGTRNNNLPDASILTPEVTTRSADILIVADSTAGTDYTNSSENNSKTPPTTTTAKSPSWSPIPETELIERGQLAVLYQMTNGFLGMLMNNKNLNDLKYLLDFQDPDKMLDNVENNVSEIVKYLLGFGICLIIGVLLMIFVPIVGLIVCCCRCCGNCGGKVGHKDKKSSECTRCCCGFLLFAFLAIVLSGGVIMAVLSGDINARLSGQESVFDDISGGFTTLARYGNQTLEEMRSATLENYQEASREAFSRLDGILPEVTKQFGAETYLNDLVTFTGSLTAMGNKGSEADVLKRDYTESKIAANRDISDVRSKANPILSNCLHETCITANSALVDLKTNDLSSIDLVDINNVLSVAISTNINGEAVNAQNKYNQEISNVDNSINAEITKAKDISGDVEKRMISFIQDLNDLIEATHLGRISDDINQIKKQGTEGNVPYLKIPGWCLLGLAVLVLIIVVCYYLGLSFGTMCRRPKQHKSQCCTWKTGACWLLVGIALTFIFYFLLMLVLIIFFATGGITHTEVCRHAYNLPNSPIAPLIDEAVQANIKNFTLNVTDTYRDCAFNRSIYRAFKLEENGINLTKILNEGDIDKVIDDIKGVPINIGPLNLFPDDKIKESLRKLGSDMDSFSNDFEDWLNATKEPVTTEPVADVANKMKLAAPHTSDSAIVMEEAEKLENLTIIETMDDEKQQLQTAIKELEDLVGMVNLTLTLSGLNERVDVVNDNGSEIAGGIVNKTADQVQHLVSGTVNKVETDVQDNVGKCFPVYQSLSTMVNSGCVTLLYAVNAYWFCMGMVLIPLVFVVVIAFKLVSLYRKTEPHNSLEAEPNLYMSAFSEQDHRARNNSKKDQEMLLKPMRRGRSDYVAMADNPVYQDDELPYAIPRAVLRTGRPVLPVHPADPDDAYYYAMPRSRSPPPKYSTSSTGF